jgi:integrase
MGHLLGKVGLARRGHTFYALRHTFETIGGESRDQVAVDAIVGHSRDDMASVYRERTGDDRLRAVAEHVWQRLLKKPLERKGRRRRKD